MATTSFVWRLFRWPAFSDHHTADLLAKAQSISGNKIISIETEFCFNIGTTIPFEEIGEQEYSVSFVIFFFFCNYPYEIQHTQKKQSSKTI